MKQFIFMCVVTSFGTLGLFIWGPFVPLAVYYFYAVLRPQSLWIWALPYGVPWSEFVAIAAIVGASLMVANTSAPDAPASRKKPGRSIGPWILVGFGLWVVGSYLNASDKELAFAWMLEYLKIIAMFLTAIVVVQTGRQVWILFMIATVAVAYIAYEMNFSYFVDGYLAIYRRGYGGMDNNGAALMIAMGVPLAFHAWEGTSQRWRWLYLATIPLMLHAVLMSYSRGAMVALVMAVPILLMRTRFRWRMALIVVVIAGLIPTLAGREIRERFFSIEQYQEDGSANSRFASWKAAIRIANENPILGAGPRNSNLLSYQFGADMEGRTIHSQYLQTAADLGYVGLALYLGIVFAGWRSAALARRTLRKRTDDEAKRLLSVANGVQCSLAVFLVGAFFLSLEVFELPYFLLMLAVVLRRLAEASPVQVLQDDGDRVIGRRRVPLAATG
jgi:probable O-glycosylation ligase (exosortase A-associated)